MKKFFFFTIFLAFLIAFSSNVYSIDYSNYYNYNYSCNNSDDTWVYEDGAGDNYNGEVYTQNQFNSTFNTSSWSYYKFYNCSQQLLDAFNQSTHQIVTVRLRLKLSTNKHGAYDSYPVYNETWLEDEITWNDQPCGSDNWRLNENCGNSTDKQNVYIPNLYYWNVTSAFPEINNGTQNISFLVGNITEPPTQHGFHNFTTWEYDDAYGGWNQPVLMFTFGEIPPEPPEPPEPSACSTIDQMLIPIVFTMFLLFITFGLVGMFFKTKNAWVLVPIAALIILIIVLLPLILQSLNSIC